MVHAFCQSAPVNYRKPAPGNSLQPAYNGDARAAMRRLLLAALVISVAFLFAAGERAVPVGRHFSPAVLVDVSEVSFPTAGPVTTAVSLLATVDADGRVSDTKVMDSAGSEWSPTLVGYEEDSISAVKAWRFSPALDVSTLKPIPSVPSVTFLYSRMFISPTFPFDETFPSLKTVVTKSSEYVPPLPLKLQRAEYPWASGPG